LHVWPSSKGT